MILSCNDIKKNVQSKKIQIVPHFDEQQLRPFGLRFHLGDEILTPRDCQRVDLSSSEELEICYEKTDLKENDLTLKPGGFVLGCTAESIKLDPKIACRIDGRSTLARLGIMVHCSSCSIDAYKETRSIVLEIANVGPYEVVLPRLYPMGMLIFEKLSSSVDGDRMQSQYAGQMGVVAPNLAFRTPSYLTSPSREARMAKV